MSDEIKNMWNNAASGKGAGWYTPDNTDRFTLVEQIVKKPEKVFPAAVYPLIIVIQQ